MGESEANKSPQLVKVEKIWKVFNIVFLIYIAAVTYGACSVYGVDLSLYLVPITFIPGWVFFLVALVLQYIVQNLKNNDPISFDEFKKDMSASLKNMQLSHPLRLYFSYLWKSFKVVFWRILFFALLMIPLSLVLSVIMSAISLFTGGTVPSTDSFSCSWHV